MGWAGAAAPGRGRDLVRCRLPSRVALACGFEPDPEPGVWRVMADAHPYQEPFGYDVLCRDGVGGTGSAMRDGDGAALPGGEVVEVLEPFDGQGLREREVAVVRPDQLDASRPLVGGPWVDTLECLREAEDRRRFGSCPVGDGQTMRLRFPEGESRTAGNAFLRCNGYPGCAVERSLTGEERDVVSRLVSARGPGAVCRRDSPCAGYER